MPRGGLGLVALAVVGLLAACDQAAPGTTGSQPGSTSARSTPAAGGSPAARTRAAAAYDGARLQVVMFGGRSAPGGDILGDTWVFDGQAWARRQPAHAPAARQRAAIAFDPRARSTLLFGGLDKARHPLHDTWRWDGSDWEQLKPPSTPQVDSAVALADDEAGRQLLLVGCCSGPGGALRTYAWTGADWRELAAGGGPPGTDQPVMTADAVGGGALLVQASAPGAPAATTWHWDGAAWAQLAPPTQPPWAGTPVDDSTPTQFLASDAAHHVDLLVVESAGGAPGATIEWDGADWTPVAGAPAPARACLMVGDAAHAGFLLVGGTSAAQDTAIALRRSDGPWSPAASDR